MWVWTIKCSPLRSVWTISQSVEGGERCRERQQLPGQGQTPTQSPRRNAALEVRTHLPSPPEDRQRDAIDHVRALGVQRLLSLSPDCPLPTHTWKVLQGGVGRPRCPLSLCPSAPSAWCGTDAKRTSAPAPTPYLPAQSSPSGRVQPRSGRSWTSGQQRLQLRSSHPTNILSHK